MKRIHLSPVTSLVVSLSLVVGILVCDLTGTHALPAAHAQTGSARVFRQVVVPAATLAGSVIAAKGVVIDGVATDAVFLGGVRLSEAVVQGAFPSGDPDPVTGAFPSGDPDPVTGAFPSGDPDPVTGAFPSGDPEPVNGAFPSGIGDGVIELQGAFPSGVISSGGGLQVIGGTLEGSNIQVTNGVISGENLVLVGACVTSSGAR